MIVGDNAKVIQAYDIEFIFKVFKSIFVKGAAANLCNKYTQEPRETPNLHEVVYKLFFFFFFDTETKSPLITFCYNIYKQQFPENGRGNLHPFIQVVISGH